MLKDGKMDLNLCLIERPIIPPTKSVSHPLRNLVTSLSLIHGPSGLSLVYSLVLSLMNLGCKFCKEKHKNIVVLFMIV